jgi:thiol:disulfide interchange protein
METSLPERRRPFGTLLALAAVALLSVVPCPATPAAARPAAEESDSAGYDPARDPAADLAVAVERARASSRRILLEVGGEWCIWCHILERFLAEHDAVCEELEARFVVVKVNYSEENPNEEFLGRYPEIPGYPHFFVLDGDGALLHSQSTGELEEGRGYSVERFLAFLREWGPPARN